MRLAGGPGHNFRVDYLTHRIAELEQSHDELRGALIACGRELRRLPLSKAENLATGGYAAHSERSPGCQEGPTLRIGDQCRLSRRLSRFRRGSHNLIGLSASRADEYVYRVEGG
jgi:hypothetical protein